MSFATQLSIGLKGANLFLAFGALGSSRPRPMQRPRVGCLEAGILMQFVHDGLDQMCRRLVQAAENVGVGEGVLEAFEVQAWAIHT